MASQKPDSDTNSFAKLTNGVEPSSPPDSPECRSIPMCAELPWGMLPESLRQIKASLIYNVTAIEAVGRKMSGGPEVGKGFREDGTMYTLDKESKHAVLISSAADVEARELVLTSRKLQPPLKLSPRQVEEAVALYTEGLSLGKIAVQMSVSRQAMHDLLKRRIPLRDRIDALPRKDATAIRLKRAATLRRYRSRARRLLRAEILAVMDRDRMCRICGESGSDIDHVLAVALGGQTEMGNLQLLCRSCHKEKSRTDRALAAALRKEVRQQEVSDESICSSEASLDFARTSPSPANAPDSRAPAPPSSSSSPESQTDLFGPEDSFYLRTSQVCSVVMPDGTSQPSSGLWPTSGFAISPGVFLTPGSSEYPSGGGVCSSLPDVLEAEVAPRYFLSPRAAAGILRRAEKRGRALPSHLLAALEAVVRTTTTPKPKD